MDPWRFANVHHLALQAFIICFWLAPHAKCNFWIEPLKTYLAGLQFDGSILATLLTEPGSPPCSPRDFVSLLRSWKGYNLCHDVTGESTRCGGDMGALRIAFGVLRRQILDQQARLTGQGTLERLRFKSLTLPPPAPSQTGYRLRFLSLFGTRSIINVKNGVNLEYSYKIPHFGHIMATPHLMAITDAPCGRNEGLGLLQAQSQQEDWPPVMNREGLQVVQDGIAISCHRECLIRTYGRGMQVFFIAPAGADGKCSAWPVTGSEARVRAPQLPHLFLILVPTWAADQVLSLQLECYQSKDPLDLYGPYIAKQLLPSYTTTLRLVVLTIAQQLENGSVYGSGDGSDPFAFLSEPEVVDRRQCDSLQPAAVPLAYGLTRVVMDAIDELLAVNRSSGELLLREAISLCRDCGFLDLSGWPCTARSGASWISPSPPSWAGKSFISFALISGIYKNPASPLAQNASLGIVIHSDSVNVSSNLGISGALGGKRKRHREMPPPSTEGGRLSRQQSKISHVEHSELLIDFMMGTFTVRCTPKFPLLLVSISRTAKGSRAVRPPLTVLPTINLHGPSSVELITGERILLIIPSRILDLIQAHEAEFELPADQVVDRAYLQGLCDRILQWIPGRFANKTHPFLILHVMTPSYPPAAGTPRHSTPFSKYNRWE